MDTANPRLSLLQAIVRATDQVPTLRVVLDHLPRSARQTAADRATLDTVLRELGAGRRSTSSCRDHSQRERDHLDRPRATRGLDRLGRSSARIA